FPVQQSALLVQVSPTNFSVHVPLPPVPVLAPPLLAPPGPPPPAPPGDPASVPVEPPVPAPGPPLVSPESEPPQPIAQRPKLEKATTTQMTSFFTPSSTKIGLRFDARPG